MHWTAALKSLTPAMSVLSQAASHDVSPAWQPFRHVRSAMQLELWVHAVTSGAHVPFVAVFSHAVHAPPASVPEGPVSPTKPESVMPMPLSKGPASYWPAQLAPQIEGQLVDPQRQSPTASYAGTEAGLALPQVVTQLSSLTEHSLMHVARAVHAVLALHAAACA
jgi:hypothetical protein